MRLAGMKIPQATVIWLGWIMWLPFLIPGIVDLLKNYQSLTSLYLTLAGEGGFVLLYGWGTWISAGDIRRFPLEENQDGKTAGWPFVVLLILLSCGVAYLGSQSDTALMSPFVFTAAYIAGTVKPQRTAVFINIGVAAVGVAMDWGLNGTFYGLGLFLITLVSFFTAAWHGVLFMVQRLDAAQAEIEYLAVNAERLRIAQDLHDLLGQKLSIIVLKSQLGKRLIRQDPERAETEIAEVEETARLLLQEVRETVERYGRPTVTEEIKTAREILLAADIEFADTSIPDAGKGMPERIDEVLAWIIREGVTNVVRHSQAKTCTFRLGRCPESWTLEITDRGGPPAPPLKKGRGIRGIESRVAGVGGRCAIGPQAAGGVRLFVEIPLIPKVDQS
jgi:two-component system sensor histidine kinase DesK